ncbi:hypothetical protein [Pontiella sulfatireligans]|uniref:PEP-CTERM protein-sorting domain-containing protein n=1 Tax=Pontiella sulfatireligans TaxID=2750658 RepID=A0A6C2UED8_9BACT|nr:hypothetical protein [Pontiella sulfatireligans]VGO18582.1 hypothetical protein SCARR_00635 [Pontiella sulfatireligans]
MKKWITALTVIAGVFSAQASLIVNGGMDAAVLKAADFTFDVAGAYDPVSTTSLANQISLWHVDQGWVSKGGWITTSGVAEKDGTKTVYGLRQISSVGAETGNKLVVSFDFIAAAGTEIGVSLFGWAGDASGLADNAKIMDSRTSLRINQFSGMTDYDLLTGNTGNNPTTATTLTQTLDGVSQTHSFSINLTGISDISDLDYFGINLAGDYADAAVQIDNVSVTAIPEPAVLSIVLASGIGILFLKRRFQ